MPGMGHTKYYWKRYEQQRKLGHSKAYAAEVAALIEARHRAKVRRRR